jgi:hypothetical protein
MNLWRMDHRDRGWHPLALEAIAGEDGAEELERKLGPVETDGGRVVGRIGKWFVERYGVDPACCVFPGTGDNPATFLSLTRELSLTWRWVPAAHRSPPVRGSCQSRHIRRRACLDELVQPTSRVPRLLPPRSDG